MESQHPFPLIYLSIISFTKHGVILSVRIKCFSNLGVLSNSEEKQLLITLTIKCHPVIGHCTSGAYGSSPGTLTCSEATTSKIHLSLVSNTYFKSGPSSYKQGEPSNICFHYVVDLSWLLKKYILQLSRTRSKICPPTTI